MSKKFIVTSKDDVEDREDIKDMVICIPKMEEDENVKGTMECVLNLAKDASNGFKTDAHHLTMDQKEFNYSMRELGCALQHLANSQSFKDGEFYNFDLIELELRMSRIFRQRTKACEVGSYGITEPKVTEEGKLYRLVCDGKDIGTVNDEREKEYSIGDIFEAVFEAYMITDIIEDVIHCKKVMGRRRSE